MHSVFFDNEYRREMGIKEATTLGKLFYQICKYDFFILSIKRVEFGKYPLFYNRKHFNRPEWSANILERMIKKLRELYGKVLDKLEDRIFVVSSPGMLMRMFNVELTTLCYHEIIKNLS